MSLRIKYVQSCYLFESRLQFIVKFGKNLGLGVVLRFVLLKHFDRLSLFDLLPLTLWIYLKNT